ncbi:Fur family transcriptional regulator [Larkinella soli]|uniref:Fur family transcriptional regulator n=1 Tax=Larkinella soli TaxID=1770527 RepID=UPI000FFBEB60|nr:transcriptional repressor [Larkinella soli]
MNESRSLLDIARARLEEQLQGRGLRRSAERFAILEEVYSRDDHFDAEDLFQAMIAKNYHLSRATVYNTLDVLADCNLVLRHRFGEDDKTRTRFEKSLRRQQHGHLICTICHRVKEFCDPRLQLIKTQVGDAFEFQIEAHSLVFYGECQDGDCREVAEAMKTSE